MSEFWCLQSKIFVSQRKTDFIFGFYSKNTLELIILKFLFEKNYVIINYKLNSFSKQINCYTFQLKSFVVLLNDLKLKFKLKTSNLDHQIIEINIFDVFFGIESEYEIGFSVTIKVLAVEGVVIIISNPILQIQNTSIQYNDSISCFPLKTV